MAVKRRPTPPIFDFVAKPKPDAAKAIGVSTATLDRMVERGDLTAHYAGTRLPLFLAEDLWKAVHAMPTKKPRQQTGKPANPYETRKDS